MRTTINGEAREFAPGLTVASLVEALALDTGKLAIEVNLAIVPRSLYADTPIRDGDAIEIVQFIGGG